MSKGQFISILFLTSLLWACHTKGETAEDQLVFRYNESSNLTTLDPAYARTQAEIWIANQLYNGLVQLDDSLQIQPDIAKHWEISQDGLTYTFTLRDSVYFHESPLFNNSKRKVIAQDFEYSFSRLQDPKVASPGAWILRNVSWQKALNDSVFQIQLKEPFPAFLGLLSMKYASVVPHEGFEEQRDFRKNPIGTGPFYFKIWEENIKLVLRKNPLYFERDLKGNMLPYLEAVAVSFLPDKQSAFLQFLQGKLDFISGIDPSYKDEILTASGQLQAKYEKDYKMIAGPYLNTEYLGFKMDDAKSPVNDRRIRLALNYCFDRAQIVLFLRNNMGIAAQKGFIPDGLPGQYESGFTYNPQLAKSLVEAYKKDSNSNKVTITLATNASYLDIAEFLQREAKKVGIDIHIDTQPNAALRQGMATGKVEFFRGSWIADYPDAENYLSLFYSSNFAPNGPNYTHFKNETFDELYRQSFVTTNPESRYALYRKMDSILIAEAPIIPLFYDKVVRFSSKKIENLGINPINSLQLKRVKKSR